MGGFEKPTQSRPKLVQTRPFQNIPGQATWMEDVLGGATTGTRAGFESPYAAPSAEQTAELDWLQQAGQAGRPLFREAVTDLERTAGGAYLDPTTTAPYQRLRGAEMNLASSVFGQRAGDIGAQAAIGGAYNTSARQRMLAGQAGEIGTTTGRAVTGPAFREYGAERARQEDAAAKGMALAPELSRQIFATRETTRSAQQKAQIDQMEAQLAALGLNKAQIDTALSYMQLAAGQPVSYIKGPSVWQQLNAVLNSQQGYNFGRTASPQPQYPQTSTVGGAAPVATDLGSYAY
jgi:hypothetical protein